MRMTILSLVLSGASLAAFAANGDVDTSFGVQGVARIGITTLALSPRGVLANVQPVVQPDGKILTCTAVASGGSSGTDILVARFTAAGVLDTGFSFDGKVTIDFDGGGASAGGDYCAGLAVQSDGRIVVAGHSKANTTSGFDFAAARLLSDGTLDPSFGAGTGKVVYGFDVGGSNDDFVSGVAIQPDGKIVLGGEVSVGSGNATSFAVLRLAGDGTRDASFNLTGRVTVGFGLATAPAVDSDVATSLALDSSGRILVAGVANKGPNAGDTDFAITRLLPNGQLDGNFNANGRVTIPFDLGGANGSNNDDLIAMLLQKDGKIVLAGAADSSNTSTINYDVAIARLLPDGSADASFGIGGKTLVPYDLIPNGLDIAQALVEQSNHKLLLAGVAYAAAGGAHDLGTITRLNADGSLDAGFGSGGKHTYDFSLFNPSVQIFNGIALQGNQIIASMLVQVAATGNPPAPSGVDSALARLQNDLIFADGFD